MDCSNVISPRDCVSWVLYILFRSIAVYTYTRRTLSGYTSIRKIFAFQLILPDRRIQYPPVDLASFLIVQPTPFTEILAQVPNLVKDHAFCLSLVVIDDSVRVVHCPRMPMDSPAQVQVLSVEEITFIKQARLLKH